MIDADHDSHQDKAPDYQSKATEGILRVRAIQQRAVAELGLLALRGTDLDEMMQEVTRRVALALGVEYCKVLQLLPSGEGLLLRAGVGWQEGYVGQATVGTGRDSQAGYTLLSDSPVVVEDLRTEGRFSGPVLLRDHNVISGMSVIIAGADGPFGVLGAHSSRRVEFTEDDVNFLQAAANLLATAVERKKGEEALRDTQERYQLILAGADAAIWDWDVPAGRVLFSPRWKEMRGLSDDEVSDSEEEWSGGIHPDDIQSVMDAVRDHFEGRTPFFVQEYRVRHKDGRWVWILDRGLAQRDADGRVVRMAGSETDITQRKRAEESLLRREQQVQALNRQLGSRVAELETLLNVIPLGVAIATDPECRFIKSNPAMARLLGVSPESNTSMSVPPEQLPPFRFHRNGQEIPPHELPIQLSAARGVTLSGVEMDVVREDGRVVNLIGHTAPLRSVDGGIIGSVGAFLDITERKQAEANIRSLNQDLQNLVNELQTVLDVSPVGIGVAEDPECRVIKVNPAFARMVGISPEVNASKTAIPEQPLPFKIFKNGREVPGEELPMQVAAARGVGISEEELDLLREDGSVVSVLMHAVPLLDEAGRPRGSVAAVVDITERKRVEGALREADQRKDQFLAMLSHELRNPLAPITNALQLLRLGQGDSSLQQEALGVLDRQVGNLSRLVDDLLDVSRVTTGRIQLHPADIELNALVRSAADSFRPQMAERRHQFAVTLAEPSIWVRGDPTRLEQVVVNLLSNAAKFAPNGSSVRLTTEQAGGEAVIRVRDSGMGMDAAMLPHVFELFSQGEGGLDRTQGGMGVGLALVKSLVEMHGGTVTAESQGLGQGSEFTVRLPAMPSPAPQWATAPEKPAGGAAVSLRVLLAEDVEDARKIFGRLLRIMGHQVRTAHDGPSALASALEFRPDVALLDIGLPGIDGYEVARRIRGEPALQDTVLVAVTGYGQESDRQRGRQAGFDHHLVKPLDIEGLEQLFAAIAKRKM